MKRRSFLKKATALISLTALSLRGKRPEVVEETPIEPEIFQPAIAGGFSYWPMIEVRTLPTFTDMDEVCDCQICT